MNTPAKLTQGSVVGNMLNLSIPMMGGIFSVIGFNLADTYFVAKLGTRELAAMSFTFPVVMVLLGVAFGLGTATTAVVSQTIGRGETEAVRRIASDSLMLSFLTVLGFAVAGIFTIDPLFELLGATDDILPLIHDYMVIWYLGIAFLVVPMVANATIRASGDTKFPALIMTGGMALNIVLDPILIFGWFGLPRLELEGAALATVIARAGTMVASLLILHFRDHMLDFAPPRLGDVWDSWKQVGYIAVPAAATNILQPVGLGVVTRLIADYGPHAVAAWGAGSRITSFVLIPVYAVCSGLVPFVGQNWGAEKYGRVYQARNYGYVFSFAWGLLMLAAMHLVAEPVGRIFSDQPEVVREVVLYLWIVPFGYGAMGLFSVNEDTLNAIGKPVISSVQTLVHMFGMYIPLAFAGSHWMQWKGLLAGVAVADVLAGVFGIILVRWMCRRCEGGVSVGSER